MRRTTKSFSPVLLHGKFKQTKVKTKIINGSPVPVYKGLEAIECLLNQNMGQSENSVVILLSGYSFVSLRHETMASITDSIS